MSWQAVRAVRDLEGIKPTRKLVLYAIAARADDADQAWPSIATIARDTGLSRGAVRRTIAQLVDDGHLTAVHRLGTTSVYEVGGARPVRGGVRALTGGGARSNHQNRAPSARQKRTEGSLKGTAADAYASASAVPTRGRAGASTNGHAVPASTIAAQERARQERREAAAACPRCDPDGVSFDTGVWCTH